MGNQPYVPFSKPVQLSGHMEYLEKAVRSSQLCGNGPFTKDCESVLREMYGKPVLVVSSATHALEMMALLLDITPGDEIICPSYTFVSTANAFVLRGATIRFVDNDENGNLSISAVKSSITKKTKAVVAVHYGGASTDMNALLQTCNSAGIELLEDAAQAIGATYRSNPLGAIGSLGCLSFHETKNVGCGEGGALILGNPRLLERAEIIREKGTDRSRFFQGLVDKYSWVDVGSSYLVSDLNAAYLYPQLTNLAMIHERRETVWNRYLQELKPLEKEGKFRILQTPTDCRANHHLFAIVFKDPKDRLSFIRHMRERNIITPFHYVSLHRSPFGSQYPSVESSFSNCDELSNGLVRLPLFFNFTDDEQDWVLKNATSYLSSL